jgi:hypothetical protein
MNDLLARAIAAHGGMEHWLSLKCAAVTLVSGGQLWANKGVNQDDAPRKLTVSLHEEKTSLVPFGRPDWRMTFTPDRVAIQSLAGAIIAERGDPRASFAGHVMDTPWDPLDRAYFNGYTLWTYLTTPFLLVMPGFELTEIKPWREGNEIWHGLRAKFPPHVASHSPEQDFYFGDDFLLRRHDYHLDIVGGVAAAQYVYDIAEADGIRLPTRRRAYLRDEQLQPILAQLLVSIDFSDIRFS